MDQMTAGREEQWRAWMLAARDGDAAAYRSLLTDLARHLRASARAGAVRAGLDAAEAEDIVQETLLAVHTKRHTWNREERFSPWVRAIAHYKLVDAIRRRANARSVSIDDFTDVLAAEDDSEQIPARDILRMAESLPEKQKAVVLAMFIDELSTADAAKRLGMTEGAVRVTLHRALSALAKRFGEKD